MKLVKHFRSHPDLLYFPNTQFYAGELQPFADPAVTHSLLRFEGLVKKNFPIIFHGIVGKDQREASSPSFFNADEVTVVIKYALDLVRNKKLRVGTLYCSLVSSVYWCSLCPRSRQGYWYHRAVPCPVPEDPEHSAS